jgi:predicted nucleotidyltransferase
MNNMLKVFTKNNIKILQFIGSETTHIRDIAEKTQTSPATVHQAIALFKKLDFVSEKKVKNRKLISVNQKSVTLKKIRSLLNINTIINSRAYKNLKRQGTVGIYGSFASGADTPRSDVDMWIYTNEKTDRINLRPIISDMTKELKREVKLLILSDNKTKELKEKDIEFYYRLKLTSVVLNGEIFD